MHPAIPMLAHPVRYAVAKPARFTRAGLIARLLVLLTFGIFGVSLGAIFFVVCISLPAVAAGLLADRGAAAYLASDAPRILRVLRWFAAFYGWLGLVTDALPSRSPDDAIHVEVDFCGAPTPGSALIRIVLALPSIVVLALLGIVAGFVWLWAALSVLLNERIGDGAHEFLVGMQRWGVRLIAYQAALVDDYPPFSFAEGPRRSADATTAGSSAASAFE